MSTPAEIIGRDEIAPRYILLENYHRLDPDVTVAEHLERIVDLTIDGLGDETKALVIGGAVARLEELEGLSEVVDEDKKDEK